MRLYTTYFDSADGATGLLSGNAAASAEFELSKHILLYDKRNASMRFVVYVIHCNSFFVSLYVSGDRYHGAGATDRRVSLHDGRAIIRTELLPFWWQYL